MTMKPLTLTAAVALSIAALANSGHAAREPQKSKEKRCGVCSPAGKAWLDPPRRWIAAIDHGDVTARD
jgi:hypothetical protein